MTDEPNEMRRIQIPLDKLLPRELFPQFINIANTAGDLVFSEFTKLMPHANGLNTLAMFALTQAIIGKQGLFYATDGNLTDREKWQLEDNLRTIREHFDKTCRAEPRTGTA